MQFVVEVPFDLLQPSLRVPNSHFVAVVKGRDIVRVEPAGRIWLTTQDEIRAVLNRDWDPIGVVTDGIEDEYDMYIGHIYSLLASGVSDQAIAEYLLSIELDRMGLGDGSMNRQLHINRLLKVSAQLRKLQLPSLERP
jgi:hypothetical protein